VGHAPPVEAEHEVRAPAARVGLARSGHHAGTLLGHPAHRQAAHPLDERRPVVTGHVGQHSRVQDDGRGALRHETERVGQTVDEVTGQQGRRALHGDGRGRVQAIQPFVLDGARPDEGAQPRAVVGVGDVERVQVDADAGHHLRQLGRQRERAARRAAQVHLAPRADGPAVVLVAVAVGVEAQPRGGADLDQRQWPVDPGQGR
jgi:hypothetical protein